MKPKYPWHDKPTWGSKELKENWINILQLVKHVLMAAFTKEAWINLWRLSRRIFALICSKESWTKLWHLAISMVAFVIAFFIESWNKLWRLIRRILTSSFAKWVAMYFVIGIAIAYVTSLHIANNILLIAIAFLWWNLSGKIEKLESKIDAIKRNL